MSVARHHNVRGVVMVCAAMLIAHALLCDLAVMSKSPTADEPLHALGAYTHVFMRDYRVNPEDPPLWNYWAMLPHHRGSLTVLTDSKLWNDVLEDTAYEIPFAGITMFQDVNDGVAFVNSSRRMMVILSVGLGVVIAMWSWQVGSAIAAIGATALYAFDPNFLAHGGIVKDDVPITLVLTAMSWALYRAGRRATVLNLTVAAVLLGAALTTKFSGVLAIPILVATLLVRAAISDEWIFLGRHLRHRSARFVAAMCAAMSSLVFAWGLVWLVYHGSFDATPQTDSRLPTWRMVEAAARNHLFLNGQTTPTPEQVRAEPPDLTVRAVLWAERHNLLPQPWLYGFLYTYQSSLARDTFLLGRSGRVGVWYYFPLAMLFKTPLATLTTALLVLIVVLAIRRAPGSSATGSQGALWIAACLSIPALIDGTSALTSNLNLGIRHVLPLYPIIYIAIGIAAAYLFKRLPKATSWTAALLGVALVIESLAAFPDYIAFFNAAAGGSRGGIRLLSDSNLDWGQDLPLLARWQREHPQVRLYLAYWGTVDPAGYGIRYVNLPGGFYLNREIGLPDTPGVVAISARKLQRLNVEPADQELYDRLIQDRKPREILGGSIYLYDFTTMPPPLGNKQEQ